MQTKILIADDEHHIRHLVGRKLRAMGYDVTEARDGADALEAARETRPDLIVSDLQMPLMSGLEFCTAYIQEHANVPVIMLTARGHLLTPEQLEGANVKLLMDKPFSAGKLVERIRQVLGHAADSNPMTDAGNDPHSDSEAA